MAGIQVVCERVKAQAPRAKIVPMSIFARDEKPSSPRRIKIAEINRVIAACAGKNGIVNLDMERSFWMRTG